LRGGAGVLGFDRPCLGRAGVDLLLGLRLGVAQDFFRLCL